MMSALCTGFLLSIVTYLTTGIFLHMSFVRYFWMMLALAGAAAVITLAVARQHAASDGRGSDAGLRQPWRRAAGRPVEPRRWHPVAGRRGARDAPRGSRSAAPEPVRPAVVLAGLAGASPRYVVP